LVLVVLSSPKIKGAEILYNKAIAPLGEYFCQVAKQQPAVQSNDLPATDLPSKNGNVRRSFSERTPSSKPMGVGNVTNVPQSSIPNAPKMD
jgi:hypothetical protein